MQSLFIYISACLALADQKLREFVSQESYRTLQLRALTLEAQLDTVTKYATKLNEDYRELSAVALELESIVRGDYWILDEVEMSGEIAAELDDWINPEGLVYEI